jgi:hypothetical protein
MARSVKDLALLLDSMVGYDPEDPVTALGIGMTDGSYTRFLDKDGLKGAQIGILRESIGVQSEPESEDFKKVNAQTVPVMPAATRWPMPVTTRGRSRTGSVTARFSTLSGIRNWRRRGFVISGGDTPARP